MPHLPVQSERRVLAVSCEELVAGLGDPVVVVDIGERIAYVNAAAEQAFPQSPGVSLMGQICCADVLFGKSSYVHVADSDDGPVDGWSVRSDLDRRVAIYGRALTVDNPRIGRRHFSLDSIPLHTEYGGLAGLALVFREETERVANVAEGEWLRNQLVESRRQIERELSRSRLLEAVGVAASSAIDLDQLGEAVLAAFGSERPTLTGALLVLDDDNRLRVLASRGLAEDAVRALEAGESSAASRLLGKAVSQNRVVTSDEAGVRPEFAEDAGSGGSHDLAVPVHYRGRIMGALLLGSMGDRELVRYELDTYVTVSDVLGQAIENARLYEIEHRVAETLQETLVVLPSHVPGVVFSRAYESATYESGWVGGDFVDVFQVDHELVGITLGDVSGKGIDAAVTTSTIRTTLRVHALDGSPPANIVQKANEVMRRFSDVESFVTLWFGLLNTRTGQLRYVCAGHPPALVVSSAGEAQELPCHDPILGAFDEATYYECNAVLVAGDRLVLYSDGVTEARAPDAAFLDTTGLLVLIGRHAARPTEELAPTLMREVVQFSDGILRDDSAILALEPVTLQ